MSRSRDVTFHIHRYHSESDVDDYRNKFIHAQVSYGQNGLPHAITDISPGVGPRGAK